MVPPEAGSRHRRLQPSGQRLAPGTARRGGLGARAVGAGAAARGPAHDLRGPRGTSRPGRRGAAANHGPRLRPGSSGRTRTRGDGGADRHRGGTPALRSGAGSGLPSAAAALARGRPPAPRHPAPYRDGRLVDRPPRGGGRRALSRVRGRRSVSAPRARLPVHRLRSLAAAVAPRRAA